MCKYSSESLINPTYSTYFWDLVSRLWMPLEPLGCSFHFHLDKTPLLHFANRGENCLVFLKSLRRVLFEGIQACSFLRECRDILLGISPQNLPSLGLNVSLSSLFLGVCWLLFHVRDDSRVVLRFADWNATKEVDAVEEMLIKVTIAVQIQEKLKSLKYGEWLGFDYQFHVKALRSFLFSSRICDLVIYVAITGHVMEVSSCFVI